MAANANPPQSHTMEEPPPAVSSTDEKEAAIGMSDLASSSSPSSRKKRALTASRQDDPDSSYAPSPSLTSSGEDNETDDDEAQNDEKEELDNEGAEQVMEEDIVQEKFMFVAGPLKHPSADGDLSTLLEEVDIEDAKRCVGVVQRLCRNRIQWLAPLMEFVYFYNLGMTAKQMEKDPEFYNIFFDETRAKTKRNISSFANDVNRLLTLEGYKVVAKVMEADKKKAPEKYWMITKFERTKQQEFEAQLKEYTESVSQLAHAAVHHYEMTQQLQVEKDETAKHKRQTTEHRMKVHDLENKLQQALQRVTELEAQAGDEQLAASRQTIVGLLNELNGLRKEHETCNGTLAKMQADLDAETMRACKAENELDKARAESDKLRYDLQLSTSSRAELTASNITKDNAYTLLSQRYNDLHTRKEVLVHEKAMVERSLAQADQAYKQVRETNTTLEQANVDLVQRHNNLAKELKRYQSQSSRPHSGSARQLVYEVDNARAEAKRLLEKTVRQQGEIDNLTQQHEIARKDYKEQLHAKDNQLLNANRYIGTLEARNKQLAGAPQAQRQQSNESTGGVQNRQ